MEGMVMVVVWVYEKWYDAAGGSGGDGMVVEVCGYEKWYDAARYKVYRCLWSWYGGDGGSV